LESPVLVISWSFFPFLKTK